MTADAYCATMSRTAAVLVVLVVLAPLSGGTVAGSDLVALTVSVTDQSGDRIANAELTARWEGGSTTETTRSNGQAIIDVPEDANVVIEVDHPEYVRNHPVVVENATERSVSIDMHQRGSATITVNNADGTVADARVILRKSGRIAETGRTSDDGTFETGVIEQGEYTVAVVKDGYYRERSSVTVDGDVDHSVRIERGSVTLNVRVTDPNFDSPRELDGMTVSIQSVGQIVTQPDGTASVGVPVNTDLELSVTGDRYQEVTRTISVEESDVSVDVSIDRTQQLRLEAVSNRVVVDEQTVVSVTDEYNESVEGATVLLDGESVGETDASGQLTVTISEGGNHTVVAERGSLRSNAVTIAGVTESGEVKTPTATATATETEASGPGFTLVAAVLALLSLAVVVARRK